MVLIYNKSEYPVEYYLLLAAACFTLFLDHKQLISDKNILDLFWFIHTRLC